MEILIRYEKYHKSLNMAGIDHLLSKSLTEVIKDNLGSLAIQKVEERLFEKHGISLTQSIEQFDKLDETLREFFGDGAYGLEKKFVESLCSIKSKSSGKWMSLSDPAITRTILNAFGDDDKKKILEAASSHPKIIYEIMKDTKLPQTSCYRKINALIDEGLLSYAGFVITEDKKRVNKYMSIFNNVRINIKKNKITVDVQLNEDQIRQSTVLQVVHTGIAA